MQFSATFQQFGQKSGFKGYLATTICFIDLKNEEGKIIEDHLWMNYTKCFQKLELKAGDIISFHARVAVYEKGYSDDDEINPKRWDYKLQRPSKTEKIGRAEGDFSESDSYNENKLKTNHEHNERLVNERKQYFESKTEENSEIKYDPS